MIDKHLNAKFFEPKQPRKLHFDVVSNIAVVTLATGTKGKQLFEVSGPLLREYATKFGADFHVITGEPSAFPFEDKFLVSQFLEQYDRVLYADADVLITDAAPNLFELVPSTKLGMCNEILYATSGWWTSEYEVMEEIQKAYQFSLQKTTAYYNAGFWIASSQHKHLFAHPTKSYRGFHEAEQHLLNARILEYGVEVHEFGPEFVWCYFSNEKPMAQQFLHFSGAEEQIRLMLEFLK